ncbi:MAG: hypothetical protein GF398_02315 [Chitinivibrionales bacterium]|nr:hypothetical protein [Chitinivibrionales bacterium]
MPNACAWSRRCAGGRELHLRGLQSLVLHVVNSIFIGYYLTTKGRDAVCDIQMIKDAGFEILNADTALCAYRIKDHVEVLKR